MSVKYFPGELLLRNWEWECIPSGALNMGYPYHTVATAVGGHLFLRRDAQFLDLHEIFIIINWICVLAYCPSIVVGDNQRTGHMGGTSHKPAMGMWETLQQLSL